jgi:single-stranded DNA-binding protein
LVNGRLQSRSWEQDGVKRSKVEVNASDVTFLGGTQGGERTEGGQDGGYEPKASAAPKPAKKAAPVIEEIGDEPINLDDIPF